jgi:hypothetical protein
MCGGSSSSATIWPNMRMWPAGDGAGRVGQRVSGAWAVKAARLASRTATPWALPTAEPPAHPRTVAEVLAEAVDEKEHLRPHRPPAPLFGRRRCRARLEHGRDRQRDRLLQLRDQAARAGRGLERLGRRQRRGHGVRGAAAAAAVGLAAGGGLFKRIERAGAALVAAAAEPAAATARARAAARGQVLVSARGGAAAAGAALRRAPRLAGDLELPHARQAMEEDARGGHLNCDGAGLDLGLSLRSGV